MPIYKTKEKNKDGLTKYKVRFNYTDEQGKAHSLTRIAYGQQEAKRLEYELSNSVKSTTPNITLDELFIELETSTKSELKQSSFETRHKVYENHIQPVLGKVRMSKITPKTLNNWKIEENKKDISLTMKKNAYTYLNAILGFAVKMGYLEYNPLSRVDNFKDVRYVKKQMQYYTPEEWQLFRQAAYEWATENNNYDFYVFFCIAYYTGLRKGEIHALRWNRINGNILSVKTSISQKLKGGDTETLPKNNSSIRDISIPNNLLAILNEHKARQQAYITAWNDDGFICGYFRPLRDSAISNMNFLYAEKAGLKHIRVHDFRHSHASVLINAGINPLDVAHRLGHSTTDQTLKTYAHLFPKESDKALPVLEMI